MSVFKMLSSVLCQLFNLVGINLNHYRPTLHCHSYLESNNQIFTMSFGSQTDSNNFKETSAALRLIQINATKYAVLVRMKRKSGQDTS